MFNHTRSVQTNSILWQVLAFVIVGLSFSNAYAARWYHVEVIVFKHLSDELVGGEDWTSQERLPNFATAVELDGPEEAGETRQGVNAVSNRTYYLRGVYDRLAASARYKPVIHKAWSQPGYSANNVRRIYLSNDPRGANSDAEPAINLNSSEDIVEGTIGLQGGRLLHVGANFVYRGQDLTTKISEFRQIKLKQLHYFDHPLFGILVRVVPYKVESAE